MEINSACGIPQLVAPVRNKLCGHCYVFFVVYKYCIVTVIPVSVEIKIAGDMVGLTAEINFH